MGVGVVSQEVQLKLTRWDQATYQKKPTWIEGGKL